MHSKKQSSETFEEAEEISFSIDYSDYEDRSGSQI